MLQSPVQLLCAGGGSYISAHTASRRPGACDSQPVRSRAHRQTHTHTLTRTQPVRLASSLREVHCLVLDRNHSLPTTLHSFSSQIIIVHCLFLRLESFFSNISDIERELGLSMERVNGDKSEEEVRAFGHECGFLCGCARVSACNRRAGVHACAHFRISERAVVKGCNKAEPFVPAGICRSAEGPAIDPIPPGWLV